MYKLGIIGYPLGHSLSAIIQKAGFESLGIAGSYDVLETPPEELIPRIKYLKTNNYNGFNVTIPLKVPMSLFLDDIDDYAGKRGFAMDPDKYRPGMRIRKYDDVCKFVKNLAYGVDSYKEERKEINALVNEDMKGSFSEKVLKIMGIKM